MLKRIFLVLIVVVTSAQAMMEGSGDFELNPPQGERSPINNDRMNVEAKRSPFLDTANLSDHSALQLPSEPASESVGELDGKPIEAVVTNSRVRSALKNALEKAQEWDAAKELTWADDVRSVRAPETEISQQLKKINKLKEELRFVVPKNGEWAKSYDFCLEPAAQQAYEIVQTLPSGIELKKQMKIVKAADDITRLALFAARKSMEEVNGAEKSMDGQASWNKAVATEFSLATYNVQNQIKSDLERVYDYFDEIKKDRGGEKSEALPISNNIQGALEELRNAIQHYSMDQAASQEKIDIQRNVRMKLISTQEESSFSHELKNNRSSLRQQAVDRVRARCQETLELAQLLRDFRPNK